MSSRGFIHDIQDQIENNANIHINLIKEIEKDFKTTLICYYSSPTHPGGAIQDHDPDLLEQVLRSIDLDLYNGSVTLFLSTPGGVPYAAGKIVKVFKVYSSVFATLVVTRALSAGTLICLGSQNLIMTETASLGPIDPQMVRKSSPDAPGRLVPAAIIIKSFKEMATAAQQAILAQRPPDPFLHILDSMEITDVMESIRARTATEQMAKDLLEDGLSANKKDKIDDIVKWFMEEGEEEQHGKHLYATDLQAKGLDVSVVKIGTKKDKCLAELQFRIDRYCNVKGLAKYIVSRNGGIDLNVQLKRM